MKDLGLIASVLIIISGFLPWIETSTFSPTIGNASFNAVSLTGISTGFGILGIIMGSISFLMFYKEMKWTMLPGYMVVFIGVIFLMEYSQNSAVSSLSTGSYYQVIKYNYTPQFGVYLFLICGLLCSFSGYNFLKINTRF